MSAISAEDKEHLVKHELFKHFAEYQAGMEDAPLTLLYQKIQSLFHTPAPPLIDTSDYHHPSADSFSDSQMVDRTAFALKKINEFNPHFFTLMEQRSINPVKLGVISHLAKAGFVGMDVGIMMYFWKSWSFNAKGMFLLAGLSVTQAALLRAGAIAKAEYHHRVRRRPLARKYMEEYGKEFMNDVVSPAYDHEKLRHMPNKLRNHS